MYESLNLVYERQIKGENLPYFLAYKMHHDFSFEILEKMTMNVL
jgi:hypothetical protein